MLLKTEAGDRNHWPMARVISCETDKDGMVRDVKLRVGKSQILRRPVDKMVLLLENEMARLPGEWSHTYRVQDIRILREPDEVARSLWDLQSLSFYGKNKILYLVTGLYL